MALSGSFSKSVVNNHYTLRVDWEATQSITDNTSTITSRVYYVIDPYYSINLNGGRKGSITINGDTRSFTTEAISSSGGTTHLLYTATHVIAHDVDGKSSISLSCSWGMNAAIYLSATNTNVWVGDITASASDTLDSIPRLSELVVSPGVLGEVQTLRVAQKSDSFTHKVRVECGPPSSTTEYAEYSVLIVDTDSTTSSETPISYIPPEELAQYNPTGTAVSVKYTIATYNGSTRLGHNTYYVDYAIPDSVKPTCSVNYTASDPETAFWLDTFKGYIKGLSKIDIGVTAEEAYGSEIASYQIIVDGVTYDSNSVSEVTLLSSGDVTITAKVVDQRGRIGTSTQTVKVLDYSSPKITKLKVERCELSDDGTYVENIQGEYARITYSTSVTELRDNHTEVLIEYKKPSDQNWTQAYSELEDNVFSITDRTFEFAADSGSSYDIRIQVSDYIQTVSRTTAVSTAFAIMHFNKNGKGLAIGKVSEEGDERLDIDMDVVFRGQVLAGDVEADGVLADNVSTSTINNIRPTLLAYPIGSIYISITNNNDPAELFGGTWERVSPYFLYAAGEAATLGETGYVVAYSDATTATTEATNSGGTAAQYIKIAAWKRTE